MRILLWGSLLVLLAMGCVPTKKVNLFQDEIAKAPTDSLLSQYENQPPTLMLRPGDLISVKVGSLTPEDYDFVKEYQARLGVFGEQMERTRSTTGGQGNAMQGNMGGSLTDNPVFAQLYGFRIKPNGTVELPYIGEVPVEGMDTYEAGYIIRDSLIRHFKSPIVRVEFLNFNFSVVGEVTNPGRFTTYSEHLTIAEAVLMAGDFTEFSDRARVKVVRDRNHQKEVFYVNLLDEATLGTSRYYLQPGDMLVVPQLPAKANRLYTIANAQFFVNLATSGIALFLLIDRISN